MTTYRYLTAAEWGMRWARPPIAEKLLDGECFVHHSAGAHSTDAVLAFRSLNAFAISTKGYSALDYDVLVHYNLAADLVTIGEGRGPWMSAATQDRNEHGEAVCVLGYFHPGRSISRHPHPAELEGVALAIVWAMVEGWLSADTKILGHRDNPAHPGATACPGDYLYAELPTVRRRVAELLNAPTPRPPQEIPMELFTLTPGPAPLFERTGGLVRWVSLVEWQAMGSPAAERVMPGAEAARYRYIVGTNDDPSALRAAQWFGSRG